MKNDEPKEIRQGEELKIASLKLYLAEKLGLKGILKVSQFPSGFSNLTYFLEIDGRELVLRRPPFGTKVKSAHDMSREYRFLSALEEPFGKIPRPVIYCEDDEVIGAPFYIMERVRGIILRGFMRGKDIPEPEQMKGIAHACTKTLVELHSLDIYANDLDQLGKPEGYIQRQVEGWSERYLNAQTDEIETMDEMMKWLAKNRPSEGKPSLIHNDFKYDNLVLDPHDPTQVITVLDWEMATIGDPLMDLGTTLGYWIEDSDPEIMKGLNLSPSFWPGNPTRKQVAEQYAELSGKDIDNILFYYVYGLFKIAVIVQQIYYRYQKGLTKDQRFANLIHAVGACGTMAVDALDRGSISQ